MVSLGFYKIVSVGLIVALVAVSGTAVYYYRLQSTQEAKPLPPTLKIQMYSQTVKFTSWNKTIFFSTSPTYSCGNGQTIPGNVTVTGLNFTEDLSGRDPGSTWMNFRTLNSPFGVFSKGDVTTSLITDFLCYGPDTRFAAKTMIEPFSYWRVSAPGNYSLFSDYLVYPSTGPSTSPPTGLVANETWTVTTIS